MADTKHRDDQTPNELDTNRITPRAIDPGIRDSVGGAEDERATGNERRGSIRPDPEVVEAPGGDQFGVAGGGIDSGITGKR